MIQVVIGATVGFALGAAIATRAPEAPSSLPKIPGLKKSHWILFCSRMAKSRPSLKTPTGKLGVFQMSPRRLEDLGLVRKTDRSMSGIWTAIWREPFSEASFLASPRLQYTAFLKSCRRYLSPATAARGKIVDGKPVTISGALGVLHMAGETGLLSWIKDPKVRKKFSNTTDVFLSTNGVF